jgi:hypothetical protein
MPTSSIFSRIKSRFLTAFFSSIATAPKDAHDYNGQNFTDVFPESTTRADDWSDQFGAVSELTPAQLAVRWAETGGQSPNYLQEQLHAAGLTNLYVHEWWVPSSSPVTARNPIPYINNVQPNNLLVNYASRAYEDVPQCGDNYQCGDDLQCGDNFGIKYEEKIYAHPDVDAEYPYYLYVCGSTFGDSVPLSASELIEAKRIIYKVKPLNQRVVLMYDAYLVTEDEDFFITESGDMMVI